MFNKLTCPKCDSENINQIKVGFSTQLKRFAWLCIFWPLLLFVRPKAPLLVCKDCGFSWEKR